MNDNALATTYYRFAESHGCYLDGILCDPELREPFLEELRLELENESEAELLERLVYLRKRGRLARKKPR